MKTKSLFAGALLTLLHLQTAVDAAEIAATVNGEAITLAEIERTIQESLRGRTIADSARPMLQAQALEQLIGQRLITAWLLRENRATLEAKVQEAIETLKLRAETFKVPLDKYLSDRGLDPAGLRQQLAWRLGWQEYLDRQITDEKLQACFEAHRRDFDGTQLRVSHILWRSTSAEPGGTSPLLKQAQDVRQQLVEKKLTFAEAVAKHSTGPSRDQGGDLGFIPRHGRMDEEFSRAAFALAEGEISAPVVTPFGVHLIQCTKVQPGNKQWTEVRAALRLRVAQELFDQLAAQERQAAKVEYTGRSPHFKPGTRDLVIPR